MTEVPSLSRDEGIMGQAQNLAKGWGGTAGQNLGRNTEWNSTQLSRAARGKILYQAYGFHVQIRPPLLHSIIGCTLRFQMGWDRSSFFFLGQRDNGKSSKSCQGPGRAGPGQPFKIKAGQPGEKFFIKHMVFMSKFDHHYCTR